MLGSRGEVTNLCLQLVACAAVALAIAAGLGGCGTQGVVLGTSSEYLVTTTDTLALPGEMIPLHARLQSGDLLTDRPGYVALFYLDNQLYRAAQTDHEGIATVWFTPLEPRDYIFTVRFSPAGFALGPPPPEGLMVRCRPSDTPIAIVDLDKTLVASPFELVLIGDAQPMSDSLDVMRRLAGDYTIVYLTIRPSIFGPKSKHWLAEHGYPPAPLLLSGGGGFVGGQQKYRLAMIAKIQSRFTNLRIGIGDKVDDGLAYSQAGMRALVVLEVEPFPTRASLREKIDDVLTLPAGAQVVRNWRQVEQSIYGGEDYSPDRARRELQEMAAQAPLEACK